MTSEITTEKEKKLKHVNVYNQLYELIQNGTYAPGSQLPSEPDLALQMKVSRMTLRKALALLQEDNLIKNIRGKGNFVNRPEEQPEARPASDGFEAARHPVYQFCTERLDGVELEFRIEPPANAITQTLKHKSPAVVIADRWYKHDQIPCAYTLSILPIELIGEAMVDLNDPAALLEFLEHTVYEMAHCRHFTFSHSTAGNFTATRYALSDQDSFLLIQENICAKDQRILVSNKHYLPIGLFKIEITSYHKAAPR